MGQLGIGGWFRIVYYKLWSEIESGVRPPGGGYICVEPGILGINRYSMCMCVCVHRYSISVVYVCVCACVCVCVWCVWRVYVVCVCIDTPYLWCMCVCYCNVNDILDVCMLR